MDSNQRNQEANRQSYPNICQKQLQPKTNQKRERKKPTQSCQQMHCCWDGKLVQLLWKAVWKILKKKKKKLKINPVYDLTIPLLGICLRNSTSYSTDTRSSMSIPVLVTIARKQKQPKYDESIRRVWHMDTMEYYSAVRKNGIMNLAGKR